MLRYLLLYIMIFILFSCNKHENSHSGLFTVLSKEQTGINFKNSLEENAFLNGFVYQYYYNGAGVATADFNNDNLTDIYFISNRRANTLYLNSGNLKFKDVTKQSNTQGGFGFPIGVTVVDINNDGFMDIYICKSGRIRNKEHLRNELLINLGPNKQGVPVFEEKAKEYLLDLPYHTTQASFFDYDRDGDLDVFLANHGVNFLAPNKSIKEINTGSLAAGDKLLRNDNGKFIDVSDASGIIKSDIGFFTLGVSIGDVNNDGWPDIYTGNDYTEKDNLYINNQNGTFTESSLDAFAHIPNFSMGTDIADMNNDNLMDIMSLDMASNDNYTQKTSMAGMSPELFNEYVNYDLHHQYMYNAFQINIGTPNNSNIPLFSDVGQMTGLSSTDWSWSPLLFDMDNDGHKDIFISNGIKRDFRDKDFSSYHKIKKAESLKNKLQDKEGYINDLLSKMPSRKQKNYFFKNNGNLNFEKIDIQQPKTSSNGAAYADFDNDGDIDVVVNNTDDYAFIYRNNSETKSNNFIDIKLNGSEQNRNALGAKVKIITKTGVQILENHFTRGFQSAMANNVHFGLGLNKIVDTIEIIWPNGSRQFDYNQEANKTIDIEYNPSESSTPIKEVDKLFSDITKTSKIDFKHTENLYDDFKKESLIPHKMSQFGPALAVGDVNNDGLDDFYAGGAKGQSGELYVQLQNGTFKKRESLVFKNDKNHEDTGSIFFDADGDGDLDLYVVSGGNEENNNSSYYEDRFYENVRNGTFIKNKKAIPSIKSSGLKVTAGDYDNDGDLDLFIGSRLRPMQYGAASKSTLLENKSTNGNIKFIDVTKNIIPDLLNYQMLTDALWVDYNNDNLLDLIITSEWGNVDIYQNTENGFVNQSSELGSQSNKGWWFSIAANDIDNDGDMDLIAGNLGLNYKYKASIDEPFHMYLNDFDKNNTQDIVLAYHQGQKLYPLRGRECSSQQMPFIKEKFKTYDAFGKADIIDVYGEGLEQSKHFAVTNFATGIFENIQNSTFNFKPLDRTVQISSVNKILCSDFDGDEKKDLLLLGNMYASEVETPRNDASYGHFLKGDGKGNFEAVPSKESGLYIKGDVKGASLINIGNKSLNKQAILIARNDDFLVLIQINK